jgi:DNA polymerase-3 subunit epsilon
VLTRDETPSHKLSVLAQLFGAHTRPVHRALDDARATVEVLHALLERIGPLGVHSLEELIDFLPEVTPAQRRKRQLAAHVPHVPGVYLFRGPSEEVLYVGTASDLRRRVAQYFTASETRRRVREMVALAQRVDVVPCAHSLEAEVRELRLLAAHRPRYNRRSKEPHRGWWLVLTDEAFPRLSLVRQPRDGALGPFHSQRAGQAAMEALQDAVPLRRCTDRIPAREPQGRPCALAEIGRCGAPCAGRQSVADYAPAVVAIRQLAAGRHVTPLQRLADQLDELSAEQRFEEAAARRDRLAGLVRTLDRGQGLAALAAVPELIAARPDGGGGWELAVVRHGRLAAAGLARRGVAPMPVVEALVAAAETVLSDPGPLHGAPAEEVAVVRRWLTRPGSRLVRSAVPWAEPAAAAASWRGWLERVVSARAGYPAAD